MRKELMFGCLQWALYLTLIFPVVINRFVQTGLAQSPVGDCYYDPDWPDVHFLISTKCVSCHQKEKDLTDFVPLLTKGRQEVPEALIVPGDPEESLIWQSVVWDAKETDPELAEEPEMPPDEHEWLTQGQLDVLYHWILNGANVYRSLPSPPSQFLANLKFPSARVCAGCHPKQYEEWSRSMHAYAQLSPVFEAFNLTLVERTGGTIGTFCTRCHTPIGTALGENESVRNVCRSRISMESVTCIVCHRRGTAHYKNNGRLPIEAGELQTACMFGPFESSVSSELDTHPASQLPYIKSSQFCGECHDVVAPTGVRNEEAFSEWQHSPAARDGVTCQHCHMGPVQGMPIADCERPLGRAAQVPGLSEEKLPLRHLTDHTFAGPDYSLLPDTEFPYRLDWMYEFDYRKQEELTRHQRKTLNELRRRNRAGLKIAQEKRYELLRNAARLSVVHPRSARCNEKVKIDVDVNSLVAGHNLPTGFTAERQVWVAIEVLDPTGIVIFASGDLDSNMDLRDEHSGEVRRGELPHDSLLFNLQNQFTALTAKGTERTVVLPVNRHLMPINIFRPANIPAASFGRPTTFRIAKGSLPPLQTMKQVYPVRLSRRTGRYAVSVRLQFRHLPPTLLDHIGTPHLKHLLEIVTIDAYSGVIQVRGG